MILTNPANGYKIEITQHSETRKKITRFGTPDIVMLALNEVADAMVAALIDNGMVPE